MYNSGEKTYNSYCWDERTDLLGTGATSNVYRARCKKSGQYYAAKVFTENRRCIVNETLKKELAILEMVNHENVVKLVKDDSDKRRQYIDVIIMEYCNGGNLATIIEKPENYFGLDEPEFLLVLKHLTDGMIELNRLHIAHRDIKPNNILLHITNKGQHIYKITDFGAAKNFEGAALSTTVGTEEYLYPEIYERAFYNTSNKDLTPGIDLWSIGVTLYHVATGRLPFKPYEGCRRDRDTMIKITKEKPTGAISGIQGSANGAIQYSKTLPPDCKLSSKFKSLLEPVLGGLIENDFKKMSTFKKFFEESSMITNLVYINIVNVKLYEIFEIAVKPSDKLASIITAAEQSSSVVKNNQLLFCNNLLLSSLVGAQQEIGTYTMKMDQKNPLVLFDSVKPFEKNQAFTEIQRLQQRVPTKISQAVLYCKEINGFFYEIERRILEKSLINESIKNASLTIKNQMSDLKLKQDTLLNSLKHTTQNLETKSASFAKIYDCISRIDSKKTISAYKEQMFDLHQVKKDINEIEGQLNFISRKANGFSSDNLSVILMKDQKIEPFATHIRRINHECDTLFAEFSQEKRSTYRQDQPMSDFGQFRCKQLNNLIDDAYTLYNHQFIKHVSDFYSKFQTWFNEFVNFNNDIKQIESKLLACQKTLDTCKLNIDKDIDAKLSCIIDFINGNVRGTNDVAPVAGANVSPQYQVPNHQQQQQPQIYNHQNNRDLNNNNKFSIGFEKVLFDINNSDTTDSVVSDYNSIHSLVQSINQFKAEATETDKVLDQSNGLLKYLIANLDGQRM